MRRETELSDVYPDNSPLQDSREDGRKRPRPGTGMPPIVPFESAVGSEDVEVLLGRDEELFMPNILSNELRFSFLRDVWLWVSASVLVVLAPESVTSESVRSRATDEPAPGDWAGKAVASVG